MDVTRFGKLWIALAALVVAVFTMRAAVYLAGSFFSMARALARYPIIAEAMRAIVNYWVVFLPVAMAIFVARSDRRRGDAAPVDRWARIRDRHTQLAQRILPPDARQSPKSGLP